MKNLHQLLILSSLILILSIVVGYCNSSSVNNHNVVMDYVFNEKNVKFKNILYNNFIYIFTLILGSYLLGLTTLINLVFNEVSIGLTLKIVKIVCIKFYF